MIVLFVLSNGYDVPCTRFLSTRLPFLKRISSRLYSTTVVDILCRLSIDQIIWCRAVCKRWHSLIVKDHFILHHCKRIIYLWILPQSKDLEYDLLYIYRFPKKTIWKRMLRLTRSLAPKDCHHPKLHASCNGLLDFEATKHPPVQFTPYIILSGMSTSKWPWGTCMGFLGSSIILWWRNIGSSLLRWRQAVTFSTISTINIQDHCGTSGTSFVHLVMTMCML